MTQVRLYSTANWHSLEFLLGQGFLGNGETDKALSRFTQAAAGVGVLQFSVVCTVRSQYCVRLEAVFEGVFVAKTLNN